MKERKKKKQKGFGNLLDAWTAPEDAGDPIGCIATSFTFSSSFFEEECMSRFLSLDTDPDEDGSLYLIEREEKLSQIICACAIVDRHHCRGFRSLRWDLLPARVAGGILHAKVSLLVWSRMARVLITSANLTEDGYRRNLEVYGVFDYREDGDHPVRLLYDTVEFIQHCANRTQGEGQPASPPLMRVRSLLDKVRATPATWGVSDEENLRRGMAAFPVFVRPGNPNALENLSRRWPVPTPPFEAHVISPFFDPPDVPNLPAKELWLLLRKRGKADLFFHLATETSIDETVMVHAPQSILEAEPSGRLEVLTHVCGVDVEGSRTLHAKGILVKDERWSLYMIGSSNFTSAGLGLKKVRNLEANVAFLVNGYKQSRSSEALDHAIPESTALNLEKVRWLDAAETEDESAEEESVLPEAFGAAIFRVEEEQRASVLLSFPGVPPRGWFVKDEENETCLLKETEWARSGRPETINLAWIPKRPPSGFWVSWEGMTGRAWWPVNVESSKSLPPPDELKDLPLEVLIDILTSARPLHRVLGAYLKRRNEKNELPVPVVLDDPHKRVDTSQFLLQRTRRISWALSALRERLARPVATEEGLQWRFYGPVGVHALIEALVHEGQSQEEKSFLLSELALELYRVTPVSLPGYLPISRVKEEVIKVIIDLREKVNIELDDKSINLKNYIQTVFETVLK